MNMIIFKNFASKEKSFCKDTRVVEKANMNENYEELSIWKEISKD